MSSESFDESSNLVVTSPNGNDDEKISKHKEDKGKLRVRDKSPSKGFGFMKKKRSKSPFSSPFKSSKPPKSPKSPSKEILTEEYQDIEKKISEKKSEEWKIFQQMQDRIKQNLFQTQSTLHKLSASFDDDIEQAEKSKLNVDETNDNMSLIKRETGEDLDLTEYKMADDNTTEVELLNFSQEVSNLKVTPDISPRGTPKPPANSLRASSENLLGLDKTSVSVDTGYIDLLGLSTDEQNTTVDNQVPPSYMNEDLLGLEDFGTDQSQQGSSLCSSFDGSDMLYSSNVQSHSEMSSCRSTPLGFESAFWEGQDKVTHIPSDFVSSMVDEFLQLDTMKGTDVSLGSFRKDKPAYMPELFDPLTPPSIPIATTNITFPPSNIQTNVDPFASLLEDKDIENINSKDDAELQPDSSAFATREYDNLGFRMLSVDVPPELESQGTELKNPFLCDTGQETSQQQTADVFSDNNFFSDMLSTSDIPTKGNIWGDITENVDNAQLEGSINPFEEDFFAADQITQSDVPIPGRKMSLNNPFLMMDGSDFDPTSDESTINPFIDLEKPASAKHKFLSDCDKYLSNFTDLDSVVSDTTKISTDLENFDPFGTAVDKRDSGISDKVENGDVNDVDLIVDSTNFDDDDDDDDDNEEDDDTFRLKIKPIMSESKILNTVTVPALVPPPRPSRSPQPPRENPFDRESPAEENFAEFKDLHEETNEPKVIDSSFKSSDISTDINSPEEENLEPLSPFYAKADLEKEGWHLMLRQPTKKKLALAGNRFWKEVYVKLVQQKEGPTLQIFRDDKSAEILQELILQPCYSISEPTLQHYDQYGKIHTVKIQYIFYKERVGIRPDRIKPSFVKKPKATMILDHAPQVSEMMKFGSLKKEEINTFVRLIEDTMMNMDARREKTLTYVKDEVSAEVWDEYKTVLDKQGKILSQKVRCRIFFLAFVTGMPATELGINDKRKDGNEVVGRHDILPIKTEEWIRPEDLEFHCTVNKELFEKDGTIRFHPLDACRFELMRYRVRLRENKELPLQLTITQEVKKKKFEIRCDLLVTGYHSFSKKHGQFPCENIEVRFAIPEQWIYLFRYERRFGYGSLKSAWRKPGKIKGLERLTMIAQGLMTPTLMETDVGVAKYENVYHAVVWRIPRLPEKSEGAYKNHLFKLSLELSTHDVIPETFEQTAEVRFTMPSCTASQTQIRSISVENPNPPDKWVRYVAKYEYTAAINHIDYVNNVVSPTESDMDYSISTNPSQLLVEKGETEIPEKDQSSSDDDD
ncbi:protein stoned-B-like [Mytilus californianus]|uniref:protein stoned-B-like n=1 Tax=Mytilus californianus TaxID=6549 RepID=UPI00224692E8|nr:protein stoned-B-like [Mytilus californianus]XP_052107160.1 protein stoned-B-like [Mytilus californianus]XP_052107161.1 protein stoned-B-like [Mytilus californianus]